jgi:cell wall-associated NlpC family hydrolase
MKLSRRIITLILVAALFVCAAPFTAFAANDLKYGIGFTTGSSLRLRSQPTTNSRILDTAEKGEAVVVVSRLGDWYKVIYNLQEGYMHADYLRVLTRENCELGYGKITGSRVNLRSGPSTRYKVVASGNSGDKVYIIGLNEGWYKVIFCSHICYIRSDFVALTEIPYENADSAKSPKFFRGGKSIGVWPDASMISGTGNQSATAKPENNSTTSGSVPSGTATTEGLRIVDTAKKYLGVRYVWGGASPSGFDCSGLVYYVLRTLGYSPYRTPADQYRQGTFISKGNLQPGDIVFFQNTGGVGITHVGIYAGSGKFIHSPNSRSVVSYADLNTGYWAQHYYGAKRMTK